MASYYYTDADRALVEEIAVEYRERLRFEPGAKRGKHWRLDGEVVTWQQLLSEIHGDPERSKFSLRLQELTKAGDFESPEYRALRKLGMTIGFQGALKLLKDRLAYWQSDSAPF